MIVLAERGAHGWLPGTGHLVFQGPRDDAGDVELSADPKAQATYGEPCTAFA